ncbi:MAG: hypothetical protein KAS32_20585 [Candidatus Peribacteraceae bacterium]|nr:hypothetical protein [Candidatus Peribacteraceae bacterium]
MGIREKMNPFWLKLRYIGCSGHKPTKITSPIEFMESYQRMIRLNYVTVTSARFSKNGKKWKCELTITLLGQEMLKFHKL